MNPYQAPSAQSLSREADRDWKWLLFSFEGRATRWDYWKVFLLEMLGLIVVAGAMVVPIRLMMGGGDDLGPASAIVFGTAFLVILVPLIWIGLAVQVKRWHDRGKSGLWVLIGLIPYIGSLWVFIECGCLRGTVGNNAYGQDPLG